MSDVVLSEMTRQGKLGCPGTLQLLKYNINKIRVQKSASNVPIGQNVNGFSVKNAGNTLLLFNQEILQPGESQSVGGNYGEVFTGRVDINFKLPTPAPATPVNLAWVTIKFYP